MDASYIALAELLLVFGLLLWFGVSQLRALKRDDPARKPETDERRADAPDPDDER